VEVAAAGACWLEASDVYRVFGAGQEQCLDRSTHSRELVVRYEPSDSTELLIWLSAIRSETYELRDIADAR
jgi:hypothetical protein